MVKHIYIWIALILLFLAGLVISNLKKDSGQNPAVDQEYKRDKQLLLRGSIPYWDQEKAYSSFSQNVGKFDYISLYWYYLGADGTIKKYRGAKEDTSIIKFAHDNNVKVGAIVTNLLDDEELGWNSKRVEKFITDDEIREQHAREIRDKLNSTGFDGVIVDYELVDANQKENFTKFIKVLSSQIHKDGKFVTVALHPKSGDDKKGEEISRFQDWKEIARYADQLSIMAYGEHGDEGEAGPIASIGWVEEIVNYALSLKIPREKLFLGIPLYGYKWQKDSSENAEGLTFEQVQKIVNKNQIEILWKEEVKSPYFEYEEDGDEYEVWFENARSVAEKINLADTKGFAGINFWRLGGEDPQIWEKVSEVKILN